MNTNYGKLMTDSLLTHEKNRTNYILIFIEIHNFHIVKNHKSFMKFCTS